MEVLQFCNSDIHILSPDLHQDHLKTSPKATEINGKNSVDSKGLGSNPTRSIWLSDFARFHTYFFLNSPCRVNLFNQEIKAQCHASTKSQPLFFQNQPIVFLFHYSAAKKSGVKEGDHFGYSWLRVESSFYFILLQWVIVACKVFFFFFFYWARHISLQEIYQYWHIKYPLRHFFLWNYFMPHNHDGKGAEKPSEIKHKSVSKQAKCATLDARKWILSTTAHMQKKKKKKLSRHCT